MKVLLLKFATNMVASLFIFVTLKTGEMSFLFFASSFLTIASEID